jgi:hypothetical protein
MRNQWLQALNEWLQAKSGADLLSIRVDQPSMVAAIVSGGGAEPRARVGLTVDSRGLIADLDISPAIAGPVPATWADVDAALRSVAPDADYSSLTPAMARVSPCTASTLPLRARSAPS